MLNQIGAGNDLPYHLFEALDSAEAEERVRSYSIIYRRLLLISKSIANMQTETAAKDIIPRGVSIK